MAADHLIRITDSLLASSDLRLAGRQWTRQEEHAEARRHEVVLAAIGRHLRSNRVATRGRFDASNGSELAMIALQSIEDVYRHYRLVAAVREGIRKMGPPPHGDDKLRETWLELCFQARVDVSNFGNIVLRQPLILVSVAAGVFRAPSLATDRRVAQA